MTQSGLSTQVKWPPIPRKFSEAFQNRGKTIIIPCRLPSYCMTDWLGWFWSECEGQGLVILYSLSPFPWQTDHWNHSPELASASGGLWAGKWLGHFKTAIIKTHSGRSLNEILKERHETGEGKWRDCYASPRRCQHQTVWCVCGPFYEAFFFARTSAEVSPFAWLARCWCVMWEMYWPVLWVLKDGDGGGGRAVLPHALRLGPLDRQIMACC